MSQVNDAALDSLDVAEADERPEVEPDVDEDVDEGAGGGAGTAGGEELKSLTQEELALESPEADTVEQKVEVRIDDDEYR